jgi:hypothetical protein
MKMSVKERWMLTAKAFGVGALVLTFMAALFMPVQQALATLPL